jgi:hypothetical protein
MAKTNVPCRIGGASGFFELDAVPVVRMRRRAMLPQFAFAACAQATATLAGGMPFVLVVSGPHSGVDAAASAVFRAWLRRHGPQFAALCSGIVVLEPDVTRRSATRVAFSQLLGELKVRIAVIGSTRTVPGLAHVLLSNSGRLRATSAPRRGRRALERLRR